VPAVVRWAKGPMAELHGSSLTDPRVSIHEGDVGDLIKSKPASYDAVLLDVDNGPEGLSRRPMIASTISAAWRPLALLWCLAAFWRCGRRRQTRHSPAGYVRRVLMSRRSECVRRVSVEAADTCCGLRLSRAPGAANAPDPATYPAPQPRQI
jgi:hypothetical protein